ncbi:MAG: zinc metalloprotease [Deltaproteobacteria bacterium]
MRLFAARSGIALLAIAVLAQTNSAAAFNRSRTQDGNHFLWWPTRSVPYFIQEDCAVRPPPSSQPIPPEVQAAGEDQATYQSNCHAAVERAFQSWQDVGDLDAGGPGCTNLALPFAGDTPMREVGYDQANPGSNLNLVLFQPQLCDGVVPPGDPCWSDNSCDGPYACFSHGEGAIALTTTTYQPSDGMLLDADIEVNDAPASAGGFDFSAEPGTPISGTTDVQDAVTHEAGHFIGLDHNCDVDGGPSCASNPSFAQGVMFPYEAPGETTKRTLKQDDIDGICHIYPVDFSTQIVNLEDEGGTIPIELHGGPACTTGIGDAGLLALLAALLACRRHGRGGPGEESSRAPGSHLL